MTVDSFYHVSSCVLPRKLASPVPIKRMKSRAQGPGNVKNIECRFVLDVCSLHRPLGSVSSGYSRDVT